MLRRLAHRPDRGRPALERLSVRGYLAWLLWGLVHVYFLIGFRNRLAAMMDWLWAYVTFQRGARLITAEDG
ncbi:MAG: hypothetical protein ACHQRJ_07875 [Alphaproteobacteria bacterium]